MTDQINPKATVLIVDDISENIHALKDLLHEQYAIIAATNGEKALELAARKPQPDLILLDIIMPGMDGYEVLRQLKAAPQTAEIPVVFVTALAEPSDETLGLKLGAADYVSKPINPDLLKIQLQAQLRLRSNNHHLLGYPSKDLSALHGANILVVDDVPENIHELISALSDEYRVTVANTGLKAVELALGPTPPDLILLDIRMPDMDGYEVCRRIKATELGYRIPIFFVSALDEPNAKLKGFALGAADYITKPLDLDETRARILTHLQLNRFRHHFEQQVTQRTAALLAMTNQLQATLNAIPDLLFELDLNGCFMSIHAPHPEQLSAPKASLIGKLISEVLPPDAAKVCMQALREALETGWSHGHEYEIQLAGVRRCYEVSASTKQGLKPADTRCIFLARDISKRKRAEAQLRKLSLAVEQSPVSIIITNLQAEIEYVNETFVQKSGFNRLEIIGQNPRVLQSGKTPKQTFVALWSALSQGLVWKGEMYNQHKNGSEIIEQCIVTPIRQADGSISHYVAVKEDITEKKAAEDRFNTLAFYDPLTGLANRRQLLVQLQQTLESGTRKNQTGALLLIDLDNFKMLNDTLGHDIGDLLLQQVAQRLITCVHDTDTVARLGGDEFLLLLENLSHEPEEAAAQAKACGEKILAVLAQPYQLADQPHRSTPSIGITLFNHQQQEVDTLLRQAELAMYKAKGGGRNTLRFFDPAMQAMVTLQATQEADLRHAVQHQQFVLYYQAQVIGDGQVTGAEALLRWPHPERGMVSPAEFIPLCEETGLIVLLGRWVLQTACAQLAKWANQADMAHLTVAVNISSVQFHLPNFVAEVLSILEQSGADPQRLKLELTESLLLDDVEGIIAKMTALKLKGVSFSLDDFGTGYSSLTYLKRLPLDQLKIDQGFVKDMLTDPNDAAIARMVIALAESMNLAVIAEGVELSAQRDALASYGCHAYQGYLFSRPLPIETFEAFARAAAPC